MVPQSLDWDLVLRRDMTELKHYDNLGTARFITFSCYKGVRLFTDIYFIRIFLDELNKIRNQTKIKIYGYVIMPEHVHLVIYPSESIKIGPLIGKLKALSSKRIIDFLKKSNNLILEKLQNPNSRGGYSCWKYRCYDHNCRSNEAIVEKINYCHKNPVNGGLVDSSDKWEWSSFNWYQGRTDVPLEIDDFD